MKNLEIGKYSIAMTQIEDYNLTKKSYNIPNLIYLDQIHSDKIYKYKKNRDNSTKWDWIISNKTNQDFRILIGDCNAICVLGDVWFGLLHAGWKWLKKWILEKMIENIKKLDKSELEIFVSHSIRSCCYEVWDEFLNYFDEKYLSKKQNWKYHFDMISLIEDICRKYWINKIFVYEECTKCNETFFSHRRWDKINNLLILRKNW